VLLFVAFPPFPDKPPLQLTLFMVPVTISSSRCRQPCRYS
jgi:hypothetical protein